MRAERSGAANRDTSCAASSCAWKSPCACPSMSSAGGAPLARISASGLYLPGRESMPAFCNASCACCNVARRRATRTAAAACCWFASDSLSASEGPSQRTSARSPTRVAVRARHGRPVDLTRRRRRWRPRLRELPQHRVHETRCPPRLQLLRHLDGLVDHRVRRDLQMVEGSKAPRRRATRTGSSRSSRARSLCAASARSSWSCQRKDPYVSSVASAPHVARGRRPAAAPRRARGWRTHVLRDAHQDLGRDPPCWRRHARLLSRGKGARPGFALIRGPQPR